MNTDNGALEFDTYFNNSRLNSTALEAERRIKGLSDTAVNEGKKMEGSFNGVATVLAGIGGTAFLGMIGKEILDTTAKFEKFGIVLKNTLGDTEGQAALDMIANFAATTPFQLDEVTGAFIKMANQGFVPTQSEMIKLGDLASSTGKGFDQLSEALLDAQTGQFERLKEFGIKASANGDKVTFSFKEQKTTVENTNSAIQAYILSLGDLNGVQGANAKISASLTGQLSNLQDKFAAMYNEIGSANSGVLYDGIGVASGLIENYETIGKVLTVLVATYGAYKAAVLVLNIVKAAQLGLTSTEIALNLGKISGLATATIAQEAQTVATIQAGTAQRALNLSILANPYVLATMALVGLAVAVYEITSAQTEAEKVQQRYNDAIDASNTKIDEEKSKSTALLSVINDEGNSREFRNKKLSEFISLNPEILNGLTLENIKTSEGTTAINAYVKALEGKIKMEMLNAELTESVKRSVKAERGGENLGLFDKVKVAVATAAGNPALGAVTGAEASMKNNKAVIDAEKDLQKKLKEEINKATGGNKDSGKKAADVIINAKYWEDQVKSAKDSLDTLNTNSKTYASDRKNILGKISQGEAELEKIRGKKASKSTAKKDTNEYDQAKIDAQKKAVSDEQALLRKAIEEKIQIIDSDLKQQDLTYQKEQELLQQRTEAKKKLIQFDLEKTLKGIDEEQAAYEAKAKLAGINKPDISSFTTMKTSATTKANNDKKAVDVIDLEAEKEKLNALLKEFKNFEESRKEINDKYNKDRQTLVEAKKVPGADSSKIDSSIQVLDQYNTDVNSDIDRQIAEKEIAFRGFMDRISNMGLREVEAALQNANEAIKNSNGSDESKAVARAKIKALQERLKEVSTNDGKDTKADVIANAGLEKSKKTVDVLKAVNEEVGQVINSFEGMDDGTKMALNTAMTITTVVLVSISGIIALSKTGEEAIKGVERASVILAIISASIQVVTAIVNLIGGAKDKKIDKEIQGYKNNVDLLTIAYDNLGRAIDKALGSDKSKLQKATIDNLKKQQLEYAKMIQAEQNRKKTDDGKVKEYQNSIRDNANEIEDTIIKMREDILGMDVSSAANDLGDAIIDAFAAGEDAAAAWGDKVNDIVGDVIRKMLIQKLVEEPVGNIINKYMAKWVDGEGNFLGFDAVMSSAQQMGTELSAIGPGLSTALEALPEDIKKYITGDSAVNSSKTALSGAVKSVSEDTAGVISGQMNAMRINQMESINVLRQQLLSLNQIAVNTDNLNGILSAMNTLVNGGRAHGLW